MVTPKPREGIVYVVSFAGYYKIGRTGNLEQRLKNLLPTAFPIAPVLQFSMEVPDAGRAERFLHREYQHKRIHGEWFQLEAEDLEQIPDILRRINYTRHSEVKLKNKPQTDGELRTVAVRRISGEASMLPLKYAAVALRKLRVGSSVIVNTSDLQSLRSIERKYKLRLSFYRLYNNDGIHAYKAAE